MFEELDDEVVSDEWEGGLSGPALLSYKSRSVSSALGNADLFQISLAPTILVRGTSLGEGSLTKLVNRAIGFYFYLPYV